MISPVIPILAFLIFFPLLWAFVCFMISQIGGWSRLAKQYRATDLPGGKKFSMASGRINRANYNSVLTIHATPNGFYLGVFILFRIGHPNLFIPWNAISNIRPKKLLWLEYMAFDIGSPAITTMQLNKKIFEAVLLEKKN
jgi:hypothetical protein